MKKETLYKTEWLEMNRLDGWYDCISEIRCNDTLVAILVYRGDKVLARREYNPAWGGFNWVSITGGVEDCGIYKTALNEVREEAGFAVTELVPIGVVFKSKAATTKVYMYSLDATGLEQAEAPIGDGTRGEEGSSWEWVSVNEMMERCVDALWFSMYALHRRNHGSRI